MKAYLEAGGRVFSTHYQYDFFANAQQCALGPNDVGSCKGPNDFSGIADWIGDGTSSDTDYLVDTTFPKGKAFADWLDNVGPNQKPPWGHANLVDTRLDAKALHAGATRWLYTPNGSYYFSWNAPVGAMPVASARAGQAWATEALFRRYAPMVCGLSLRLLGHEGDADDLAQDCFATAFLQLGLLENPDAFAGWLRGIVVRTAYKRLRTRRLLARLGLRTSKPIDADELVSKTAPPRRSGAPTRALCRARSPSRRPARRSRSPQGARSAARRNRTGDPTLPRDRQATPGRRRTIARLA